MVANHCFRCHFDLDLNRNNCKLQEHRYTFLMELIPKASQ